MADKTSPNDVTSLDNPFATRYVRPGAQAFLFSGADSLERLVSHLRKNQWWGEIVGPHGVGKSTLLASLIPALREAGRYVIHVTLRDSQRHLPREVLDELRHYPNALLIVDGYEQVSRLSRWLLRRRCRRGHVGLLVTAHQSVGLPDLYHVVPSLETVQRLVARITSGRNTAVTTADVEACFSLRGHDVRETLFDLYNLHHRRSRQTPSNR